MFCEYWTYRRKDNYVTDFCQVVGKPEWIPEPFNKIEQKSKGKQK